MLVKRLLFVVFSCFIFLNIRDVNALSVSEEVITNFYLRDNNDGKIYDFKLYKYDDDFLYSLNFNEHLADNKFELCKINHHDILNISLDKWNKIQNIIYFGYGYNNHTEIKWYLITQYMLFMQMDMNYSIIDEFGTDILIKYREEYDEFKNILQNYYTLPSYFLEEKIEFNYGDEYLLEDKNNVDDLYKLIITSPGRLTTKNDAQYMYAKRPGVIELSTINKLYEYNPNSLIYNSEMYLVNRAGLSYEIYSVPVYAHGYGLSLKVVDENGSGIANSVFYLYNSVDKNVAILVTNSEGKTSVKYLPKDDYYLLQTESHEGYEKIIGKINLQLDDFKTQEVLLVNKEIKGTLKLNLKYKYLNSDNLLPEDNATFAIYNNEQLVFSGNTDDAGYLEFILPVGDYTLKQVDSSMGFVLYDDVAISVSKTEDIVIDIINEKEKYLFEANLLGANIDSHSNIIKNIYLIDKDLNTILIDDYKITDNILQFETVMDFKSYTLRLELSDNYTAEVTSLQGKNIVKIIESNSDEFVDIESNIEKNSESHDSEAESVIVKVPNTGIYIRPIFIVISITCLLLSIVFYVKK